MRDQEDNQTLDVMSGGLKIGYARVSTDDQELLLQYDALKKAGCSRIYEDKASGQKSQRPGLENALKALRPGDTLVVWRLDRLGRSLKHLVTIINDLNDSNVRLEILVEGIDTSTSSGRMIAGIFGSLAEYQVNLIRENTLAGLRAAKREGRIGGRKTVMTPTKIKQAKALLFSGSPVTSVAETLGVAPNTLYRNLDVPKIKEERYQRLEKEFMESEGIK